MRTRTDIAIAVDKLAQQIKALGTNDCTTNMGTVEMLAMETHNVASALESIAVAIEKLADK